MADAHQSTAAVCRCGQTAIELAGAPIESVVCHCESCRTAARGFERDLARAIAYIKRYHATAALIILDVDRLKPINDSFGHAAGDAVLKAIAAVLSGKIRSSDAIARLGGDEFAILLWNLTETDARAKADLMEQEIDSLTFTFRGRTVSAGASAGIAMLDAHAEVGRALEAADSAMYLRKAQRRHEGAA